MAVTGKSISAAMGTQMPMPGWDDILILGAQLNPLPLDDHEPVSTMTVIGKHAKRPMILENPVYISHMSFGALSKEIKTALAKGSAMAHTAMCSGEGGILPEEKVTPEIAALRGKKPGEDVQSPSKFSELKTKEDLKEMVSMLRRRSDGRPIGIKIAAGRIERDLEYCVYAEPDFITIDGCGGATGALIAAACQQYRICGSGRCPVGIATQNPELRKRMHVEASAKRAANYLNVSLKEL